MRQEISRGHCTGEEYKKFYDAQANSAELSTMRKGSRMKPMNWAVHEVLHNTDPCNVLDIGCQHGIIELALASLWYNVTAIDIADKYVEASKKNTEVLNEFIDYHVMSVEDIYKLNKTFDVITCLSVLEHVKDFDVAMECILNVANEHALLLFLVPIGTSWMSEEHTRVFTKDNLKDYFPKGFEYNTIHFSNDPYMQGWFAIRYFKE